jgi:putative colanic acid biosynthesis acetyltransferase WcaF
MNLKKYKKIRLNSPIFFAFEICWYFFGDPLFRSRIIPFSAVKVTILRLFGCRIGKGCNIKPGVKIKFPWRLAVGNYVWLGEDTWIDNLDEVEIGNNVCISQGVYLCTGNHNWKNETFDLILGKIKIEDGVWIGAKAVVGPGVTVEKGAVLTLGSITAKNLEGHQIYAGNPAISIKSRKCSSME